VFEHCLSVFAQFFRLILNMATAVDDEDYAHVVLICSGQFTDPDLDCRLTDITRQLHMLTTGYTHILLFNVYGFKTYLLFG